MNENGKPFDGEQTATIDRPTRAMLLSALKKGHFDREALKIIKHATKIYQCEFTYKAGLSRIKYCYKNPVELDRETKITIISILKKGYFSEQDYELIDKKIK